MAAVLSPKPALNGRRGMLQLDGADAEGVAHANYAYVLVLDEHLHVIYQFHVFYDAFYVPLDFCVSHSFLGLPPTRRPQ